MEMLVRVGMSLRNTQLTLYALGNDSLVKVPYEIRDFFGGIVAVDLTDLPKGGYALEAHALREGVMFKLPPTGFAHFTTHEEHSDIDVYEGGVHIPALTVKVGCNLKLWLKMSGKLTSPVVTLDGVEQKLDLDDVDASIIAFRLSGKHDPGEYTLQVVDGETRYPAMTLRVISDIMGNGKYNQAVTTILASSVGWATEAVSSVAAQTVIVAKSSATTAHGTHDFRPLLEADGAGYVDERLQVLTGESPSEWYWLGEPNNSLIVSDALLTSPAKFADYVKKAAIIGDKCDIKETHV